MSKILVTGGTGLLGNALRPFLSNAIFMSSVDANLYDIDDTYRILMEYQPDTVIHLAADVGGLFKNINDMSGMLHRNLTMNTNIITACVKLKIKKFIGCLSTCIFPAKVNYPITEHILHDGEPHPSNYGYAYAKRIMEVQCRAVSQQFNYCYRCIIPTNIYGPYDNFNLQNGHVIPSLIHKAYIAKKNHTDFVVAGSGKPLRQFIYSKDLAHIISQLAYMDDWDSPMIIADKLEYSIFQVSTIISQYFDIEDRLVFDINLPDGQYKKTADNTKLIQCVGDYQFTTIEHGLKQTIEWFIANYAKARK